MPALFTKKILPLWLALLSRLAFAGALPAAEVLERRISVEFQQTPLKDALEEVARQGQFEWSYHAGIIAGAKPVTLKAGNWTVRETLYALLGEGYEFRPNGNYVILKKLRRPPDELSGYVTDPHTGQRLANATVYDRRSLRATTTDDNGFYQLKKTGRKTEIVVAKLGYRDTVFQISSNSPRFQKIDLQVVPTDAPKAEGPFLQTAYSKIEHFFSATMDRWNVLNVPDSLHRHFQVSMLPKIGTNHRLSGQVENDWSLNVLAGQSRSVRKLEVGGLGNFTDEAVRGVQVGGLFNLLRGDNHGIQVAGLVNQAKDTLAGIQVGGLVNAARHSQAPSVQVGGLVNVARKGQSGIQVAGLVNRTDTLQGVQVSGLVNRARTVQGVQIGLINSTDELQGVQIGLINRSGRRWLPIVNW